MPGWSSQASGRNVRRSRPPRPSCSGSKPCSRTKDASDIGLLATRYYWVSRCWVVQPSPPSLDIGLCQPDAIRTGLARCPGKASCIASAMGSGRRGQGQSRRRGLPSHRTAPCPCSTVPASSSRLLRPSWSPCRRWAGVARHPARPRPPPCRVGSMTCTRTPLGACARCVAAVRPIRARASGELAASRHQRSSMSGSGASAGACAYCYLISKMPQPRARHGAGKVLWWRRRVRA